MSWAGKGRRSILPPTPSARDHLQKQEGQPQPFQRMGTKSCCAEQNSNAKGQQPFQEAGARSRPPLRGPHPPMACRLHFGAQLRSCLCFMLLGLGLSMCALLFWSPHHPGLRLVLPPCCRAVFDSFGSIRVWSPALLSARLSLATAAVHQISGKLWTPALFISCV